MIRMKFLFLFIPFLCLISSQFSFAQDLNSILSRLIYDPNESYESGRSVMLSIEDGEIYTSTKLVPAAPDGSNAPKTANAIANEYWGDQSTTTASFESSNPNFASSVPSDINTTALSQQVAALTNPGISIGQVAVDDPDLAETSTGTRIINISTRGKVVGSEDDDALVGGFVVRGTPGSTIRLIIRGLGPYMNGSIDSSLLLSDPILEVRDNKGGIIATNDNWKTRYSSTDPDPATTLNDGNYALWTTSFAGVGLQDAEAGLILDLPIWNAAQAADYGGNQAFAGYGIYTAIVKGVGGLTGIGQVAIDDPDLTENGSGNRIINISTRGFVGTGSFEDLVGGFVIRGPVAATKNFVVRGLGPYMALTTGNNIFVTDPFMRVEKSGNLLSNNDNWKERYSNSDPDPSSTLNNGNYSIYTTNFSGVGLQDKEAGLLLNLDIDNNGYGIYSNSVKYSAP